MPHLIFAHLTSFAQTAAAPAASARHVPTILELVAQATIPVKVVIVILSGLSFVCWYIIGYKWLYLTRAARENEAFLKAFYDTRQLNVAAEVAAKMQRSPVSGIFRAGYEELRKIRASMERPLAFGRPYLASLPERKVSHSGSEIVVARDNGADQVKRAPWAGARIRARVQGNASDCAEHLLTHCRRRSCSRFVSAFT